MVTRNGSSLVGKIKVITPMSVTMQTEYAGAIVIDSRRISRLETDSPLTSKLNDGTVVSGLTVIKEDGYLEVESGSLMHASLDNLKAAWIPGDIPPAAAGYLDERRWKYSIATDITGKQGNTKAMGSSIETEALLFNNDEELRIYASMDWAEVNDKTTSDEMILGSSYVIYPYDSWGWFVSTELERDSLESIDIRASVSGGLSYRLFNTAAHRLEIRSGIGYRHESFDDGEMDNSPIIDLGLNHKWSFRPLPKINPWLKMTNILSFKPSIKDLGDYLLVQDSGMDMPIGNSNWKLRLGIKNDYKSQPAEGREELDTTYYSRLMLDID